jgi:hypothetical protein
MKQKEPDRILLWVAVTMDGISHVWIFVGVHPTGYGTKDVLGLSGLLVLMYRRPEHMREPGNLQDF